MDADGAVCVDELVFDLVPHAGYNAYMLDAKSYPDPDAPEMNAHCPPALGLLPGLNMHLAWSLLAIVVIASCGGRPRLVVELGGPVQSTEERSTGFDPEIATDNGNRTFMGARLPSLTVFAPYEGVEVFVAGRPIWHLEEHARASLRLIDGVVVEADLLLDSLSDLARIEPLGRSVEAQFDHWQERHTMPWPEVVAALQRCTQSKTSKVDEAGRFVDVSSVKGFVVARCAVNPSGITYRIEVELHAPETRARAEGTDVRSDAAEP